MQNIVPSAMVVASTQGGAPALNNDRYACGGGVLLWTATRELEDEEVSK